MLSEGMYNIVDANIFVEIQSDFESVHVHFDKIVSRVILYTFG